MIELLLFIAFLGLLIGTFTDFKIREVPDWVSYSLIILGLGLRLIYSTMTFNWMFFVYGLIGFGIFFGLACLMYYTGQWGGGDAKVLMGLGALLGFDLTPNSFIVGFFINLLFVGVLYGLVWSVAFAIKNRNKFLKEFKMQMQNYNKLKIAITLISVLFLSTIFLFNENSIKILILAFSVFFYLNFYLFIFINSVQKSSMYKIYPISKLREGDWIARVIKYKGKYICGPKDLGISKKQIALLKKYNFKKVLVKEGIPFIPSFLIAFIVTYLFGNLIFYFLKI